MDQCTAATTNPKTGQNLREAIIDLYLNVKIRNNDEIEKFDDGEYKEEKARLLDKDPFMVLDYIRSSVEIIMSIKSEDPEQKEAASVSQRSELPSEAPKGYEQMLQKLEEEVRTHVGIEQQLKLHIDNLQAKAEDDEKSVGSQLQRLRDEVKGYKEQAGTDKGEIARLKDDLAAKVKLCESFEEQAKSLSRRCKQLEQKREAEMRMRNSGLDSTHTQNTISAEEKLNKFNTDVVQLKRFGELAERNHGTRVGGPDSTSTRIPQTKKENAEGRNLLIERKSAVATTGESRSLAGMPMTVDTRNRKLLGDRTSDLNQQPTHCKKGSVGRVSESLNRTRVERAMCEREASLVMSSLTGHKRSKSQSKRETCTNPPPVETTNCRSESRCGNTSSNARCYCGAKTIGGKRPATNCSMVGHGKDSAGRRQYDLPGEHRFDRVENMRQHSVSRARPGTSAGSYLRTVQQQSTNSQSSRLLKLVESKLEEITVKRHYKKKQ